MDTARMPYLARFCRGVATSVPAKNRAKRRLASPRLRRRSADARVVHPDVRLRTVSCGRDKGDNAAWPIDFGKSCVSRSPYPRDPPLRAWCSGAASRIARKRCEARATSRPPPAFRSSVGITGKVRSAIIGSACVVVPRLPRARPISYRFVTQRRTADPARTLACIAARPRRLTIIFPLTRRVPCVTS